MLDEQPVGALAAGPVAAHADQDPAAVEPPALEREFEIALFQGCFGALRALRLPIAAVPQLDRAAAILALGDGALEVAIVERVILDLDGEPLVMGIQGRAARDGPRLEHAIQL